MRLNFNIPNESFHFNGEDSNNEYLGDNLSPFNTIKLEDSEQNDYQLFDNPIYFIQTEVPKNNNDFQKQKIESEEKKINKTQEATIKLKSAQNKMKKKIIFKTKKILSQNKKNKIQEKKNESKHTKYANDNMIRKIKSIVINHMMDFINKKIEEKYINNGNGIRIKKLLKMKKEQVSNTKTNYNIDFLNRKLKDIFSENITSRYTNPIRYPPEKNKNLIEELTNEQDEEKKNYFNNLFNLTFIDCLEHFINKKFIPILKDLELFEEIIKVPEKSKKMDLNINEDEYIKFLKKFLENYEYILRSIKQRNKK